MKRNIAFIPIVMIGLVLMIFNTAKAENHGEFKNGITQEAMRAAIDSSADFLARQIRDDGSFIYHTNIITAIPLKPYYNWVRHAAAVVALEDYYHLTRKQELVPLLKKAVERMEVDSIGAVKGIPNASAVWDDAKSNGVEGSRFAILGGAGLGLLALIKFNEIEPNAVPVSELESLGNFILAMQKPSGDLFPTWNPEKGGRSDEWASPYNAGEAALGLIAFYEFNHEPRWLNAAESILNYLVTSRAGQDAVPVDHWALMATGKIWQYLQESDKRGYKEHTRKIIKTMLSRQIADGTILDGSYSDNGVTTTSATILEGLLASEFIFRDEAVFHQQVTESIRLGMRFLLDAQIKNGDFKGAIPRSIALMPLGTPEANLFNRRATVVRIDYVQHVLSAYMQYLGLLAGVD